MTLSWKELVLHGILKKVGEPSLVKELLKMAMKERWLFLEKESREFHSENVEPVLKWFRFSGKLRSEWVPRTAEAVLPNWSWPQINEAQKGYRPLHSKVMYHLISSWQERIPEKRRRAVMMNKETGLLRWRGDGVGEDYHSIEDSIKWYGGIHEGRYYLFWDKKIGPAIKDTADRRKQQRSFLMSGFDINIIDGEGLPHRPPGGLEPWIHAFNQWTERPHRWRGRRRSEFIMVHSIGKKEKRHIDDMFLN